MSNKLGYENIDIVELDNGKIMIVLEDTSFKTEICAALEKPFVHTQFDRRPGFLFENLSQAENASHKIVKVYNEMQKK